MRKGERRPCRLVLLTSGLIMTVLALDPMEAFAQFDKSMTNSSLIIVICSSMGFAATMSITKCDLHLVSLLTKPLNKLGVLLLPCCMIVTGSISSLSGMRAAIGPMTLGIMTGSGDVAGFAFNEAVTPHAPEFGMTIPDLGCLAIVSATLGRVSSPIAAGVIIAGIAKVSPIEVIKRSLPVNVAVLVFLCFIS